MSPAIVSLLFAAGAATWLYTKFQRYTGNNTQNSLIAAGVSGTVIFFIFFTIFNMITK
jgi:hypothetical protein